MNKPIVRLFGLVLVLYGVLVAFTTYWSVIDAKGLRENALNRRSLLEQERVRRGEILTADGVVLAKSIGHGHGSRRVFVRTYPQGPLYGNAIGYSFIDRGQVGIEKSHNDELVGNQSEFTSILDQLQGHGQEGDNLVTSLDSQAQRVATTALAGRCGAAVAIEPATGRVRTMVSVPGYDPNQVASARRFRAFNSNPLSPLFNRATQSGYPPGSTFKVVTAAAAIDSHKFTPTSVLSGRSPIEIGGASLSNFSNEQFGDITLTDALTHSVNTVFAQVGERLGADTLRRYMSRFGFGSRPQLDYPRDQLRISGLYDGAKVLGGGDPIDVGRVAIGQERLAVTPLQMVQVAATIANRGQMMRPQIWDRVVAPDGRTVKRMKPRQLARVMSVRSAATLGGMMANVVREGTGGAAALSGIDVAGKTGTAEVGQGTCGPGPNQAWFIGFAPLSSPKIAVAVTVERTSGQGGTDAAPIVKQLMETLLR
ncbi:MAG: penicillin-binding protein [Solirubrobacterales bacterium]|jgi:peptidoglycan glycosyltransferase|nr:penicillin-binding protein [Solirubrobacterales bacterium]